MIDLLPIFPLDSVYLFPGTLLPLHIFEPRYRLMLEYCMENDGDMGITNTRRNGEIDTSFGWGKVVKRESLDDGRSNIILQGMGIAEILDFQSKEPFIIAKVEKREQNLSQLSSDEYIEKLNQILELTRKHLINLKADSTILNDLEKLRQHPFPLDVIAAFLDIKPSTKHEILVMEDQLSRADLVINFLINKLHPDDL